MAIPHSVLAFGWVPFTVVLVLIFLFSFLYVRYYQARYESELCSTLTAFLGLAVALLTCALMPVDIFIVSYMKTRDGQFEPWATEEVRNSLEDGVLYAYYVLYGCSVFFVFFLLPFSYFFYEEGDEETTTRKRCITSLIYSFVCLAIAGVLFLIGALVPFRNFSNNNSTDWQDIENIFKDLGKNHGEDAISFVMSCLMLVGMLALIVYTAYGMSAWPMDLVKGRRSTKKERTEVEESRSDIQRQVQLLQDRYPNGRRMSTRDRRRLDHLQDKDDVLARRERHLLSAEKSWLRKCCMLLRPIQIIFGIIFFLFAVLVFLSLLLTNIDKIMHSLGVKMGYFLPERKLPNPIDIILVFAQQVFPLDYCLMVGIIAFFFFCSMAGIRHIGVWFCWIRMYNIRPGRTRPQGLLFLCFLLMFIVLALNVLIYQLTPQYSSYGSQHYRMNHTETVHNSTVVTEKLVPCSTKASPDDCTVTRFTMLLTRFLYKMWFFGAAYFYASWIFLATFVIGFLVSVIRKRRSSIEGEVDKDDITDSDEELLRP